jgi:hypothetical protein
LGVKVLVYHAVIITSKSDVVIPMAKVYWLGYRGRVVNIVKVIKNVIIVTMQSRLGITGDRHSRVPDLAVRMTINSHVTIDETAQPSAIDYPELEVYGIVIVCYFH